MPKKEKIQEMFDSIAPEYDAFNHTTSLGIDKSWRRKALKYIQGPSVLDIACGTGDFSIQIALSDKKVTGVDISEGMLKVMREKVAKAGLEDKISCQIGDCAALPFAEGSFDSVTVAFGVRNFEDREACLKEIRRVLKPGGKFVMLELGVPSWQPARWIYNIYFTKIMPHIGGKMSGNKAAYNYLPASVLNFPKPKAWLETLRSIGFTDLYHRPLTFGICRLYVAVK